MIGIYFGLILGITGVLILGVFLIKALILKEKKNYFDLILNQISEIQKTVSQHLDSTQNTFEKTLKTVLEENQKVFSKIGKIDVFLEEVQNSLKEISSFQEIFKTPKLRGRFGELYLEHLLGEVLSKEQYQIQYRFKNGAIVDAIIKLPDKRILPIDAKFPVDYFEKASATEEKKEREVFLKAFISILKKEIDEISQKYILHDL